MVDYEVGNKPGCGERFRQVVRRGKSQNVGEDIEAGYGEKDKASFEEGG